MSNVTTCSGDCLEERTHFIGRLLQILENSQWDDLKEEGERIGEQKLTKLLRILEDSGRSSEIVNNTPLIEVGACKSLID